ncbi:MAG: MBL fold metallo-hydrolase [Gemmataceae bacterium]|nr:MBL fold metallo-hydrolase [Gemmataceae bacterium]
MARNIRSIESQPFGENTYVLWRPGRTDCLVVDPGFEPELILEALKEEGLTPAAILNTHGHSDHIAGNEAMKQWYPAAPLLIGAGDAAMLTDPMLNLSGFFGDPIVSPPADRLLNEGEVFEAAGFALEILEIPGHSPGHIVFVLRDPEGVDVIGGDVLFAGSIGRTDFPGGSLPRLLSGIRTKLWPMPDTTRVFPGHGPPTTVGEEKRSNPFCAGGG